MNGDGIMENTNLKDTQTGIPLIGDNAPAFRAMTTMGKINFPEDYKGSWVILFSHPADFTPVCTTEFIEFADMQKEFEEINTKLIGLSIDSLHSHLAWIKSIESIKWENHDKVKISFPIIADISMKVAKQYGMLHTIANTQTVRAVFIIDPKGIVRAVLYYPMSTGRNMAEIKRIIQSLQLHDAEDVATPANWKTGDNAVLGAPLTLEEAAQRENMEDVEVIEWYLASKKL